jgi:hypothetical protein
VIQINFTTLEYDHTLLNVEPISFQIDHLRKKI